MNLLLCSWTYCGLGTDHRLQHRLATTQLALRGAVLEYVLVIYLYCHRAMSWRGRVGLASVDPFLLAWYMTGRKKLSILIIIQWPNQKTLHCHRNSMLFRFIFIDRIRGTTRLFVHRLAQRVQHNLLSVCTLYWVQPVLPCIPHTACTDLRSPAYNTCLNPRLLYDW